MKKITLILILALANFYAFSQFTFTGKVFDKEKKEAAKEASVSLAGAEFKGSTQTDALGNFKFDKVPAGTYTITIRHLSYPLYYETFVIDKNLSKEFEVGLQETELEPLIIAGDRINDEVPTTVETIDKKDIEKADQGQDLPFLLNSTPSTVVSSDAGNGVGYTGVRIRGIDPTRVNVNINGIPLNDGESQGVFWVNMPDLASSTQDIEVQRGVGTSTNGSAAFGASINVNTSAMSTDKFLKAKLGYGSFNSQRFTLEGGSGTFGDGFAVQARLSYLHSDGFIDRASSDLISGNLTASRQTKKSALKLNILMGLEETYQAWNGIPEPKYKGNTEGVKDYIQNVPFTGFDSAHLIKSDGKTYNYYTYDNEIDHYNQNHYQLFYHYNFNEKWRLKTALHATTGKGYFEQYQRSAALAGYGINPVVQNGDTIQNADVIERKWLDNLFYGAIASIHFKKNKQMLTIGSAINRYQGLHFGEVLRTEYGEVNQRYYEDDAVKDDANAYIKYLLKWGFINPYIDLQYRNVNYSFYGLNENYEREQVTINYPFFNPKVGATMRLSNYLKSYVLYAVGNREPARNDVVDFIPSQRAKPEHMTDLELGADLNYRRIGITVNYYNMQYTDALVLNGQINDVGAYTRVNVPESYRKGWEFSGYLRLAERFRISGNMSFSQNKIVKYTEYVYSYDLSDNIAVVHEDVDIAFSPNMMGYLQVDFAMFKNFYFSFNYKKVGTQYLDNTQSANRQLDAFSTYNAAVIYKKKDKGKFKNVQLAFYANNLTSEEYAPNGYTYGWVSGGERRSYNFIYPMAGINYNFKLSFGI